jgi:putative membrane protein
MIRTIVISITLAMAATVAFIPAARAQGPKAEPRPYTQAFLKKAAEMQQAQIALALLVDGRATNKRVKQFGEDMIMVHKKMSQDIQQMAVEKGVQLPSELSDEHKQKMKELTQLSGHAFDREYMNYILRDHQNDVNDFEENMQTVEDPAVLHWTYRTLPMLRAHVEDARWIKMVLHAMD